MWPCCAKRSRSLARCVDGPALVSAIGRRVIEHWLLELVTRRILRLTLSPVDLSSNQLHTATGAAANCPAWHALIIGMPTPTGLRASPECQQ
uniref:Uncharacterized protein n=1 Tax=Ralstonia solanacearum TaxID=305 RepID=A0A0S4WCB0_RALSL|nr:protein of unknown function [Ralstonia solanacearum]